ncbi:MAG: tryptophan-rich sensory protein [Ruminococcaceae bacterium]|nr:tryptophan-rich sensory protein [Oscillospiraceae bacterium]
MSLFQKIKPYLIAIPIPLAVGGLSAWLSGGGMDFYDTINVPPFAPPAILFPIVWGILYVLMGVSSAIVYTKRERNPMKARDGLALYGASLVVNFFYSIFLFRLRLFLFTSLWILLLLALIAAYMWKYARVSRPAAYLQIPYLIWTAFATYLTFAIYLLNK